jgi:hypothetical protein
VQVWLHGRWFGITHHRRRLGLRLVIAALVLAAALYGSLRAYVEYEAHRATSMLAEASRVQVGATEASVLQLIRRYGGYKWTPEPLPPREDWTDLYEYEYQKNMLSDYGYILEVKPFGFLTVAAAQTGRRGQFDDAARAAKNAVPPGLRPILGMRDWFAGVQLSIRGGRVQQVSATVLVKGRSEWIGHEWEFANAMPRSDMQSKAFTIESAILEMEDSGGMEIQNYLTPRASEEEFQAARSFNTRCLTSIASCDGLCDLAPRALQYLKQHPDVNGGVVPPKCQ